MRLRRAAHRVKRGRLLRYRDRRHRILRDLLRGGAQRLSRRVFFERFVKFARGLEAILHLRLHRLDHDRFEVFVDLRPHLARRRFLAAINRIDQLRQRAAVERQLSGEHLVQHDAGGVDIGARAGIFRFANLLGRHVVRRPEEET